MLLPNPGHGTNPFDPTVWAGGGFPFSLNRPHHGTGRVRAGGEPPCPAYPFRFLLPAAAATPRRSFTGRMPPTTVPDVARRVAVVAPSA